MPHVFEDYVLTSHSPSTKSRCNSKYWFLIKTTTGGAVFAFNDRERLLRWLEERGLSPETEVPERGTYESPIFLSGSFRREHHLSASSFAAVEGEETITLSNGRLTLAKITQEEGGRVVHVMGAGLDRPEYDPGEYDVTDDPPPAKGPPIVTPENRPAGKTVRLISGIARVIHTPKIVEGKTSSTGKTITVTVPKGSNQEETYRLDTETIFAGDPEFRESRSFEIYTPERLRRKQRANHAPGPQAGADEVSDPDALPPATHVPRADAEEVFQLA